MHVGEKGLALKGLASYREVKLHGSRQRFQKSATSFLIPLAFHPLTTDSQF